MLQQPFLMSTISLSRWWIEMLQAITGDVVYECQQWNLRRDVCSYSVKKFGISTWVNAKGVLLDEELEIWCEFHVYGQLYRRLTQVLSHTSHRRLQAGGLSPLLDWVWNMQCKENRSLQEVSHCTRQKSSGRDIFAMVVTKWKLVTIFFRRNITFFSAFVLYMNFEFNFFIFLRRHNLYHALTYDSPY